MDDACNRSMENAWKTDGHRQLLHDACTRGMEDAWKTDGHRQLLHTLPPTSLSPEGWANSIDTATGPGSGLANSDTATSGTTPGPGSDPESDLATAGTATSPGSGLATSIGIRP